MKRFVFTVLGFCMCLAAAISLAACQSTPSVTPGSAENEEQSFMEIELGDLILKYPEKWSDKVKVTVNETTAAFSAKDQPLFDIILGESNEYYLGTTADGTKVYLKTYEVSDDSELLAMQEDSNDILNHLIKDYQLSKGADQPTEEACFAIETSVATLYYPEKWKNVVEISEKDGRVTFSCEGTDLFSILYNSDHGSLIGTYNGVSVSLENYEVSEEKHMLMQEAANDVLQHLYEDDQFKSAD